MNWNTLATVAALCWIGSAIGVWFVGLTLPSFVGGLACLFAGFFFLRNME